MIPVGSVSAETEASRSFLPDEDRYRFYLLLQAGFAVSAIECSDEYPWTLDQP